MWRRMLGELGSVTATRRQPVEIQAEWLTASEFGDEAFVLVTQLQLDCCSVLQHSSTPKAKAKAANRSTCVCCSKESNLRCSAKRNYRQGEHLRTRLPPPPAMMMGQNTAQRVLAICLARTLLNIDIPGRLWRRRGAGKGCGKFALLESEHGVLLCLCSKRYGRSVIFFIPTQMVPPKSAPPDDVSPV